MFRNKIARGLLWGRPWDLIGWCHGGPPSRFQILPLTHWSPLLPKVLLVRCPPLFITGPFIPLKSLGYDPRSEDTTPTRRHITDFIWTCVSKHSAAYFKKLRFIFLDYVCIWLFQNNFNCSQHQYVVSLLYFFDSGWSSPAGGKWKILMTDQLGINQASEKVGFVVPT